MRVAPWEGLGAEEMTRELWQSGWFKRDLIMISQACFTVVGRVPDVIDGEAVLIFWRSLKDAG